jgi:hypothetical protein
MISKRSHGHGLPIAALCKRFYCLYAVNDGHGHGLPRDVGLTEVEVEGDSLIIFNDLGDQDVCFASYIDIIKDIQQLACSLEQVGFSHVHRDGNRVAHVLARKALELSSDFLVWLEDVPVYLEDVIQSEFLQVLI